MIYPEIIFGYFCFEFDIIFPTCSAHLSDWSPVLFELFICYVSSIRYVFYGKVLCQGHSFMSHQCTGVSIVVIQWIQQSISVYFFIIFALLIVTTVHTCCNCIFSALLTRLSIVYYMIFDPTVCGNTLSCLGWLLCWKFKCVKLFFSISTKSFIWLYSFMGSFVDFCGLS